MAEGEYFMWAAVDDFWRPTFVEKLVDQLEVHREASLAWCGAERIWESGTPHDVIRYGPRSDLSRVGHMRLSLDVARGNLLHVSMYGLFRRAFLQRAFEDFPPYLYADVLFTCQVALATRIRYVDEVLFVRQIAERPIHLRLRRDPDARMWTDPLSGLRSSLAAAPYLLRSRIIPWHRKPAALLIGAILLFECNEFGGLWNLATVLRQRVVTARGNRVDAAGR